MQAAERPPCNAPAQRAAQGPSRAPRRPRPAGKPARQFIRCIVLRVAACRSAPPPFPHSPAVIRRHRSIDSLHITSIASRRPLSWSSSSTKSDNAKSSSVKVLVIRSICFLSNGASFAVPDRNCRSGKVCHLSRRTAPQRRINRPSQTGAGLSKVYIATLVRLCDAHPARAAPEKEKGSFGPRSASFTAGIHRNGAKKPAFRPRTPPLSENMAAPITRPIPAPSASATRVFRSLRPDANAPLPQRRLRFFRHAPRRQAAIRAYGAGSAGSYS